MGVERTKKIIFFFERPAAVSMVITKCGRNRKKNVFQYIKNALPPLASSKMGVNKLPGKGQIVNIFSF